MERQLRDLTENQNILVLSKYSKHLICRVCRRLFQKPIRLHPCGHTFCEQCVKQQYVKLCPRCDQFIEILQNDLLASRLLADIKVKCTNQGCPWRGNYQQFALFHKNQCSLKEGGLTGWLQNIKKAIKKSDDEYKFELDEQQEGKPRKLVKRDVSEENQQGEKQMKDKQNVINAQNSKNEQNQQHKLTEQQKNKQDSYNGARQEEQDSLFYQKYLPENLRTKRVEPSPQTPPPEALPTYVPSNQFMKKYFQKIQNAQK